MRINMIYALMFLFLFSVFYSDGFTRPAKEYCKIVGGNPEGSKDITEFVGNKGLKCPKNTVKGKLPPNPYSNDKKLFSI